MSRPNLRGEVGVAADSRQPAPIESVDRALRLVELLRGGEPLSVKAAAGYLDVAPSTAHRLLSTLVYRDFATRCRDHRYQAGPALVSRSDEMISVSTLRTIAHASLEMLHERTGETTQLMLLQRANIRFIDGIESESPLRVGVRIGDQMPAHCSAGGKALLAELSNADLERLYQQGLPPWPTARITNTAALKRQLATIRKNGYGTNSEETEQGVTGLGVAIHHPTGRAIGAFTLAIPTARFDNTHVARHVSTLQAAAATTEQRLRDLGTGRTSWRPHSASVDATRDLS
ncbi:MAG: IclR family transcriptional regulator [Sciscionella sp.]